MKTEGAPGVTLAPTMAARLLMTLAAAAAWIGLAAQFPLTLANCRTTGK